MAQNDHSRLDQMKERQTVASDVPLYRSYGVKKKLRPWRDKLENVVSRVVLIWITCVLALATVFCVVGFCLYFPELWIKVALGVILGILLLIRLTRIPRKRRKFYGKLKKLCKKNKFRLRRERNFLQSFFWTGNREDFILETGSAIYYTRFLTVRKYRSTVFFEKPDEIRVLSKPLRNKFTVIFDIAPRAKHYPLDFNLGENVGSMWGNKRIVKALLVNPVSEEMRYKDKMGGYETTGSGGVHFGYTVFTASGFLESIQRSEH
jgi:hypothetical protein